MHILEVSFVSESDSYVVWWTGSESDPRMRLTCRRDQSISSLGFHSVYCMSVDMRTLYCCDDLENYNINQFSLDGNDWKHIKYFR